MPLYWVIFLITALAMSTLGEMSRRTEDSSLRADESALAHNMLVYRNAVAIYAQQNNGATGPVVDSALVLPTWFVHLPGVQGYVSTGSSYVFFSEPPKGLVTQLVELTDSSVAIGYASAGRLISPLNGAPQIALPPVIPEGSAVTYK